MQRRFAGLFCAALYLSGCGGDSADQGVACTLELRPGIAIEVLDAAGAAASCGAQAVITASGYSETARNPSVPCDDTLRLSGAFERAGTYNVTVSKPGFQPVVFSNVVVTADVCHVVTVNLTAQLKP